MKDKPFIVFHDAYPYFEQAFGLAAVGSISDAGGSAPSAKRLGEIRAKLAETNAVCVFREPQFDSRFAETVIEGSRPGSVCSMPWAPISRPVPVLTCNS